MASKKISYLEIVHEIPFSLEKKFFQWMPQKTLSIKNSFYMLLRMRYL